MAFSLFARKRSILAKGLPQSAPAVATHSDAILVPCPPDEIPGRSTFRLVLRWSGIGGRARPEPAPVRWRRAAGTGAGAAAVPAAAAGGARPVSAPVRSRQQCRGGAGPGPGSATARRRRQPVGAVGNSAAAVTAPGPAKRAEAVAGTAADRAGWERPRRIRRISTTRFGTFPKNLIFGSFFCNLSFGML